MTRKAYIKKAQWLAVRINKNLGTGKTGECTKAVKRNAMEAAKRYGSYEAAWEYLQKIAQPLV